MNSENPIVPKRRFKNGVFAALDLCAEKRAQESGVAPGASGISGHRYVVERAAAIIEAEVSRLGADDLTALEALCASHVLTLDAIFNHVARESARSKTLSNPSIGVALRAQSQCRMTLKTLTALTAPRLARRSPADEGGKKNRGISTNELLNVEISAHDQ